MSMEMEADPPYEAKPPSVRETAVLIDPWYKEHPVPLDGVLERTQFPPWMMMTLVLILALVLFQVISAVAVVILLLGQGMSPTGSHHMSPITPLAPDRSSGWPCWHIFSQDGTAVM